jgi:hypothetical protein
MSIGRLLVSMVLPLSFASTATLAVDKPFSFVAIGDMPYAMPADGVKFERLIERINEAKPAFTIHVGDIKGGASPCTDDSFRYVRNGFDRVEGALVYTPGDNEWTDCHRGKAGGWNPLERLRKIREMFVEKGTSLGRKPLSVLQQAPEAGPNGLPENATWKHGGVRFGTLHVVGSNNNLGREAAADAEYEARSVANAAWLKRIFADARAESAAGLVLAIHANPLFERESMKRTGFNRFIDGLTSEALTFRKPVLLIHGDTHKLQFGQPLFRDARKKQRIDHFFRLEVMGASEVHGVIVTVDPASPGLFAVAPLLVGENRRSAKP